MTPKFLAHVLLITILVICLITCLFEFTNLTDDSRQLSMCGTASRVRRRSDSASADGAAGSCHQLGTSVTLRARHKLPVNPDVKKEAMSALHVALLLQQKGQTDKAQKVFQQALKLDPDHADILAAYGEFLELHLKDVLQADHYYKIALEVNPVHSRAQVNRQRTSSAVEEIDRNHLKHIDQKRALFYTVPASHPALIRAKEEAYFAHIYHSNAIEGNTLTLAETRSIVETKTAVGRRSLTEQNEVLGLDAALSYINNSLVNRVGGSVSLQDILNLHQLVLGYVDPAQAGRYRSMQVFVGDFMPAPPADVPLLMESMLAWVNSKEAQSMHPIEFAAVAHYELVFIHPFYDGNGRTSRLLMNVILMRAGYPPVSVLVEDRMRYYETLEMANNGDIRPFIRFIAESTERTLDEYLAATMENPSLSLQQMSLQGSKLKPQSNAYFEKWN